MRLLLVSLLLAGCHGMLPFAAGPAESDAASDDVRLADSTRRDREPVADAVRPPDRASPDSSRPPLFEDDFSSGTKLQDDGSGVWNVGNGEYYAGNCVSDTPDAWVPGASWGDVRVSARVRVESDCLLGVGEAGVMARVVSATGCMNRYYFCAIATAGDVSVGRRTDECSSNTFKQSAATVSLSTWYRLQLVVTGGSAGAMLTCTLLPGAGDPVTVTYLDQSLPAYTQGSAGVFARESHASFDDLKVEQYP